VVIHGDCRAALPCEEAASFDACIADPPYGDTSLKWDKIVPGWIPAVARVLKPATSIWVFGSLRFLVPVFAEMEREGFRYSQDIVWEKQNGTGFHNDRFRRVHEHAVLFYRGPWSEVYHSPQFTNDATKKTVRRKTRPTHTGHIERGHYVSQDGGPRLCRSVLQIRNEHGRAVHPTQKPVELVELLIQYSCPFGGRIVSPFGGSGTDGVAAINTGREFLLCEINPEDVQTSTERVAEALENRLW
jgi:site-specific DNA-methyltransferase (adenine-specific)